MAGQWFYAHGDERKGPFTASELQALARSGAILKTDTVWKQGVEKGVPASKVQHLFPPAPVEAAPPAPEEVPVEVPVEVPAPVAVAPPTPPPAPKEEAPAPAAPPGAGALETRKRRAVGVRGAIVFSQDGEYVQFRKKCTTCGHEDSARSSARILPGMMKMGFFCTKCRKNREVALQGFQI